MYVPFYNNVGFLWPRLLALGQESEVLCSIADPIFIRKGLADDDEGYAPGSLLLVYMKIYSCNHCLHIFWKFYFGSLY